MTQALGQVFYKMVTQRTKQKHVTSSYMSRTYKETNTLKDDH